jgi:Coenzyme PQQ synthesis protein D (PqqD)
MSLLTLADTSILDTLDNEGVILDIRSGRYFELNATATLMLTEALAHDTLDEILLCLQQRLDASCETIVAGLRSLIAQLRQHQLLAHWIDLTSNDTWTISMPHQQHMSNTSVSTN